jgi:O-antigen ligase/polysaccharide polymerase Wzy-like membrane protein
MTSLQITERPWHVDLDRPPRSNRIDEAAVLIVLVWSTVVLPRLVQSLTAPKHQTSVNETIPYSRSTAALSHLCTLLLLGWCIAIIGRRLANLPADRRILLVLLIAPWVYMITRDIYAGVHLHLQDGEYPMIVLALWVLRPPLTKLVLLGYLSVVLTVVSLLMGLFLPAKGIYHALNGDLVNPDKKLFSSGNLIGPLTSENNLGQVLVLGLPFIALARNKLLRVVVVLITIVAVLWTASRSSIAALAIGGIIALVLQIRPRRFRLFATSVLLLTAACVMVALPVSTSDGPAFSNRGYIWIASLRAWSQHRIFGLGTHWYPSLARYEEGLGGKAFHGHNTFVHMAVIGGSVMVLLLAAIAVVAIVSAVRWAGNGVTFPAVLLGTFFVSATLELSFAFYDRDFLLAVTVLPLALILFAPRPPRELSAEDVLAAAEAAELAAPEPSVVGTDALGADDEPEHLGPRHP